MESQSDGALMKLVQGGETAHLAVLFERHHVLLFRYLLALTGNRATSEDLVQEAFFRAMKNASKYDTKQAFPVWIYGIARNAYFDVYRKRRREVAEEGLREMPSTDPLIEATIGRQQDIRFLQEALRGLTEEKREALVLSRFHNLRYEEIARVMGCEVGTVKTRVFRALKALRTTFCELRKEKVYDV